MSSIPATAISVRRGAVSIPAAPSAAISAVVASASVVLRAATPAHGTHSPITLVLVHQIGIVRIRAATETGAATSSTSSVNQLQQFGIYGLSGLLQHPDQFTGLAEVPRSEEGVGSAFVSATGCAADAMDVVL